MKYEICVMGILFMFCLTVIVYLWHHFKEMDGKKKLTSTGKENEVWCRDDSWRNKQRLNKAEKTNIDERELFCSVCKTPLILIKKYDGYWCETCEEYPFALNRNMINDNNPNKFPNPSRNNIEIEDINKSELYSGGETQLSTTEEFHGGGYECPDCSATLGAKDRVCVECGLALEEDHEENRGVEEDDEYDFECPDCGILLGEDDMTCSKCGAIFKENKNEISKKVGLKNEDSPDRVSKEVYQNTYEEPEKEKPIDEELPAEPKTVATEEVKIENEKTSKEYINEKIIKMYFVDKKKPQEIAKELKGVSVREVRRIIFEQSELISKR